MRNSSFEFCDLRVLGFEFRVLGFRVLSFAHLVFAHHKGGFFFKIRLSNRPFAEEV